MSIVAQGSRQTLRLDVLHPLRTHKHVERTLSTKTLYSVLINHRAHKGLLYTRKCVQCVHTRMCCATAVLKHVRKVHPEYQDTLVRPINKYRF